MQRKIYLYQLNLNKEIIRLFKELDNSFKFEKVTNDLVVFTDTDCYTDEPIDYDSIRELIIQDFAEDLTLYIEPFSKKSSITNNDFYEFFKDIDNGIYYIEDLIISIIIKGNEILKKFIISEIVKDLDSDTIDSVLGFIKADMNSSKAAKAMYLHRNTLNYRLDKFIEKTNINIRTFKGANAVYMLLKYK
ncbi:MAG: helix-turn-helix domain-containing protein [Candidatus Izemoplasma sp.]